MANIQAELAAIMAAVYGEEVRGSIHDAIKKINDVSEVVLTTGTAVDSPTSPTTGFFDGSLYLNTNTNELWKCTGSAWASQGFLKGDRGDDGENGNRWFRGSQVSASSLTAPIDANENDNYLNTAEGKIYHCVVAGNPSTWVYDMTLTGGGGGGGVSDYSDLDGKPQIENHVLNSGNNTAESLGLATKSEVNGKYTKPSTGIPKSDLANEINEKLSKIESKADTVEKINNATESADKLASALGVQKYANKYVERYTCTIPQGATEKGIWQEGEPSTWVIDEDHMVLLPMFYNAEEITFLFDAECGKAVTLAGYQYVSETSIIKDGKPCGGLCFKLASAYDVDVKVAIDISKLNRESLDDATV